jgi:PAS domain S-box-containing protein
MSVSGSADSGVRAKAFAPEGVIAAIVNMSDDAIFTCDMSGRVVSWSAAAERLFGRTGDDTLDGRLDVLFPAHLSNEVEAVLATVLAGDRIRHFETEIVRPDGMPLPVSLSLCPIWDASEVPVGSVVIARDVTEQRLAQATLAEVDARMAEGEALAHIGSWLWDLRTGAVQWSAEFHRIHGVDPLDFDGTFECYLGLIHSDDREFVRAAMVQSVESGRPFNGEYRVMRPLESERLVRVRAQPTFGSAGTAVGLRGIGQDVTDRDGNVVNRDPRAS